MFISQNKVRMHDTDMAGILYFPRQFRFAHDALEDFMESEGFDFETVFHKEKFIFVVVHAEADYLAPLAVGDRLETRLSVEKIGVSSFVVSYLIYKQQGQLVGKAKTAHVCLNSATREKMPIPPKLLYTLKKHLAV